ncbi:DUF6745 domain-containing protein [Bradyrhizobium sp. GCM10027634]|uniref:DUF6745 domain-containing protein n=1 Tax=unclassified Bradyrhizobium TaxID=2631580 RepID=UPI00188CCC42|nr:MULTISPECIES: hypothetical protein [unclassified Bradyrhizobium]MDN5004115.1 hypothetical protein [Bradyrhizobium sp. WYCCWR 12677]QOZ45008.1 hypothetical protein XH89_17150 [Bradyrhizobium sp. CCBAU 53340]
MRASSPTEQALSAGQTAALGDYRARWRAIGRATAPADRDAAEEGARLAYQAAELEPPARIVWCDGPLALAGRRSRDDGRNVRVRLVDRLRRRIASLVKARLHRKLLAAVDRAVDPTDPLIRASTETVIRNVPEHNLSVLGQLRRTGLSLSGVLEAFTAPRRFASCVAGPHDLSWLGAYDYLREVFGLHAETEPLRGLMRLATSVGWLLPHEHSCWLTERPNLLSGDARDRLHHASGPALRYPDGWSIWAWRGVEVPRWIIEQQDRITLAAIDEQIDVQVRRCMIEIMTPERYVALGGATRVAEDETGILWRRNWLAADAWAAVEVVNATPEPDGTRRHFFLQVPANLRTAREAVAWTYGMRAEAYAHLVLRT